MALTDKNILITPSIGAALGTEPTIAYTGANGSSSATLLSRVFDTGSLSFEAGTSGQVNFIGPGLTGNFWSVTDISGIPSLQVFDTGQVNIASYQGYVNLGSNQQSTTTGTGALRVLGGVGISGNLNIGGSFALSANLAVGGAASTYGLSVSTTTNVAGYLTNSVSGTGLALQVGTTNPYPLGIGFNSYNNNGTTTVIGNGYNGQLQLTGSNGFQFYVSGASQSAAAVASQVNTLNVNSTGLLVPVGTAITAGSTTTGAIVTYGGIAAGGSIITGQDAFHGANGPARFGTGPSGILYNTVGGYGAGSSIVTGGQGNTLFGYNAGNTISSGGNNTILGYNAAVNLGQGSSNTAIGQGALNQAAGSTVQNNVAIGKGSMASGALATGNNTAVGVNTLLLLASGANNTAIGYGAGSTITSNNTNVMIGYNAGNTLAYDNCVIIGGNSGATISSAGQIIIATGNGTARITVDGSGNVSVPASTSASATSGVGALIVSGGASIASGLNLGGTLYANNSAGTNGYFLQTTGTGIQWAQAATSISNITTAGTYYPLFTNSVSGTITTDYVDSTHLVYNPNTGSLSVTGNTSGGTGTGRFFTGLMGVNVSTTNPVGSGGTVMQIGFLDASTNLLRIGDGTSSQNGYRFRVDQGYNFVCNSGSGDNLSIASSSGALSTPGTITGGAASTGVAGALRAGTGGTGSGGDIQINNSYPTIWFNHTSQIPAYLHNNSNLLYVLRGSVGAGAGSWSQVNGQWPFIFNLSDNSATAGGNLNVVGDINYGTSDERLKNIEGPILDALAKVRSLEGFYYTDNEISTALGVTGGRRKLGLSAQKLQATIPEVVIPAPFDLDDKTGESRSGENYLTAQYERVVPLLVNAINELADTVDAQQAQIAELTALVKQLLDK